MAPSAEILNTRKRIVATIVILILFGLFWAPLGLIPYIGMINPKFDWGFRPVIITYWLVIMPALVYYRHFIGGRVARVVTWMYIALLTLNISGCVMILKSINEIR